MNFDRFNIFALQFQKDTLASSSSEVKIAFIIARKEIM